jgi:molybdopterin converting factor subunit 1
MAVFTVLMFARAREIAGASQVKVEINQPTNESNNQSITVQQLVTQLITLYPALSELVKSMMMAVNMEYEKCDSQRVIEERDEIAVIPPISGG